MMETTQARAGRYCRFRRRLPLNWPPIRCVLAETVVNAPHRLGWGCGRLHSPQHPDFSVASAQDRRDGLRIRQLTLYRDLIQARAQQDSTTLIPSQVPSLDNLRDDPLLE